MRRQLLLIGLVAGLAMAMLMVSSSPGAPKKKDKGKKPEPSSAAQIDTSDKPLFSVAGQAGLPKYLKCNQGALADEVGIHDGEVRTLDTDFFNKDFLFDVAFVGKPGRSSGFVGIGENGRDGGWIANSVLAMLKSGESEGEAEIEKHHQHDYAKIGKFKPGVPNLLRIVKKGDQLTMALCLDYKGTFKADAAKTIDGLAAAAPFLNRLNSPLFFGGEMHVKSVYLEVDGKAVDPGEPANKDAKEITGPENFQKLGIGAGMPAGFEGNAAMGPDGLELKDTTLHTLAADYLNKDFTLDVVYRFKPESKQIMLIGLGENGRDSGNWILNSICSRVHGPGHGGICTVTYHNFFGEPQFAKFGPDHAGPNLFRLQKRGNTLTMAVMADYKDKFQPDFTATLPSLSNQCPYLTDKNTHLFLGEGGTVEQIRLIVGGEAIKPGTPIAGAAAVAPTAGAVGPAVKPVTPVGTLADLSGQSGMPAFLRGTADTIADDLGLTGGIVRTTRQDLIEKDFTFDLLMKFNPDGQIHFGLGQGNVVNWNLIESTALKIESPNNGCDVKLVGTSPHEILLGNLSKTPGICLMRLEKKRNTLTFAICTNYKAGAPFTPSFVRTIPDIKAVSPYFTHSNSGVFFMGGAHWMGASLIVDGKPEPSTLATAPAGTAATPAAQPPGVDANPAALAQVSAATPVGTLIGLSGQSGMPAFLRPSDEITADGQGISGGYVRTVRQDLFDKDFTLDLLATFHKNDAGIHVGMGQGNIENWHLIDSLLLWIDSPDRSSQVRLVNSKSNEIILGQIGKTPGTCLLRVEKKGNTLTFAVCTDYKAGAPFTPLLMRTIPDLKSTAPFFNAANSGLYFDGGATWMAVSLIVNGKPETTAPLVASAAPGGDAAASHPVMAAPAGPSSNPVGAMFSLAGESGLPLFLHGSPRTLVSATALNGDLRGNATDLLEHDFTFDLLFSFSDNHKGLTVGFGEGAFRDWQWQNSIAIDINGDHEGQSKILKSGRKELDMGKLGSSPGPHLLRVQKKGNTLTFAVCPDYKAGAAFVPAITKTMPDLKSVAPFLSPSNSGVFASGGANMLAVALIVDGRGVDPGPTADHGLTQPIADPLANLAGAKALPAYFIPNRDLGYGPEGLVPAGVSFRTREADLIDKNFTFDMVYHFAPGEGGNIGVGIGGNRRDAYQDWIIHDSVYCHLHGPSEHDGFVNLGADKVEWRDVEKVGEVGKSHVGLSMLRVQKRGNTLTFAVCPDFKGTFAPTMQKTIPDLRAIAPYLMSRNSPLWVKAGTGVIDQVRLVIEGGSDSTNDVVVAMPLRIVAGQPFRTALLKPGVAWQCALDANAPKGLTVSPAGELSWTPSADQVGRHDFTMTLAAVGRSGSTREAEIEVVSASDAKAVNGDLARIDSLYNLPMESSKTKIATGFGNGSLLLLDGDQLRRLAPDGFTVQQTIQLPKNYNWIGERKNYFVGLSNSAKSLDIIDKQSMQITRSIQMDYRQRYDLCLHPFKPTSYVSVSKVGGDGISKVILTVDELSGDVREPDGFMGTFLKISPDGRTLYSAYSDIYRRGDRLLFNPNTIDVIPDYGNIDILIIYDISGPVPRELAAKNEAGGNGQGLAMSPDGNLVSYLSFVGYPMYSKNISAWDPHDLTKRPVLYATKDHEADCTRLAFHPALPIAATPAKGGAACFDSQGGAFQGTRLLGAPLPEYVKVSEATFSPDGKWLLLTCDEYGQRYLRRVRLKLTPAEAAVPMPGAPQPPARPAAPAPFGAPGIRPGQNGVQSRLH